MDKQIKILVVEDELIIGAKISLFLTEMGYEVTGIIARAEEVLLHLQLETPDLILLDIQLKGAMDGIDLSQILQQKHGIPVIFLTANSDDASFKRAKETKPYGFLSKPFKKLELKRTLELALNLIESKNSAKEKEPEQLDPISPSILPDRIFVYYQDKRVKIMFDTILYVQAERNYCRIVTKGKEYLLTMPMKNLENELPKTLFQRIHRSHIVNLYHVSEVDESMVKVGEQSLVLSKSYRTDFLMRIPSV